MTPTVPTDTVSYKLNATVSDPRKVWGGMTAAEREQRRREQFLDAGLAVFGTAGWHAATVAGICREARLSQRYFYELFDGREALFLAVVDRIEAEVSAVVLGAITGDGAGARARSVLAALATYAAEDPRRVRLAMVEAHGTPELRAARDRLLTAFSSLAARLMRALNPHADPDRLAATAQLLSGGLAERLAHGEPLDIEHLADVYAAAASAC